jgi:hypothetical protein
VDELTPGTINLFQGLKYEEADSDHFAKLQPLLNHVKEIICKNDERKYNYYMKWWASILQLKTVKHGTMPIVFGAQGSGKSFVLELFCEILGVYALMNVDDMDKVFGKFNGLLPWYLLINVNEPPQADERFRVLGKIKSILTQKSTIMETKGVDQIEIVSWANYHLTSNNDSPILEEKGDRRLIYFDVDNSKCGDEEYFNNLCKPFQPKKQGPYVPEMMSLLLHYMMTQIDITDFNAEKLIRDINTDTDRVYNEQLERQYHDLNAVERYVVDNSLMFELGYPLDLIAVDGYKSNGIAKKLNAVCTHERVRIATVSKLEHLKDIDINSIEGERVQMYKLKPANEIPDLYNIIKYHRYQDKAMEAEDKTADEKEAREAQSA